MSTPLLPDALWNLIQPLLPPSPRRPKGGRPRLPDRACRTGILDPDDPFPRAVLAADYSLNGQPTLALTECSNLRDIAQSGKDPMVSAMTAYACAVSGDRNEAQTILARLKSVSSERYVDPYGIAMVYRVGEQRCRLRVAGTYLSRTFDERGPLCC